MITLGLDVGGAHLKAAWLAGGVLLDVAQVACPLWQGLDKLEAALGSIATRHGPVTRVAVTMTGELVDLFSGRAEGVARILGVLDAGLPDATLDVFAGAAGFLTPPAARERVGEVASANWCATVLLAARCLPAGILVDIGSTTTDLVPFAAGRALNTGSSDAERLDSGELVYTGVVRTPLMAVAARAPVGGAWRGVMAECFATMADAHRLVGTLPEGADLHPTADGRGKGVEASARRLARMVGADADDLPPDAWRRLAMFFIERQLRAIDDALAQVASRGVVAEDAPLVAAGVGRFLVDRLAARAERPHCGLMEAAGVPERLRAAAADAAPAVAVALLRVGGRSPW